MSVDDCFVPLHAPFHRPSPFLVPGARHGSLPSLAGLDLGGDTAISPLAAASAAWGDTGARTGDLKTLNGPAAAAASPRPATAPLGPLAEPPRRRHLQTPPLGGESSRDDCVLHPRMPSLCKDNFHGQDSVEPSSAWTEQEQCHPSEVAVSRTAPRGRYARSKAGWASKGRSTPEGYNREEHAWRFQSPFPPGMSTSSIIEAYKAAYPCSDVVRPPKAKKSPEQRNAIREKIRAQRQSTALYHAKTALCKYNRANNTKFELVEIAAKCPFFEFGGGCCHYNFTAKAENHNSADDKTKLFFAEINYYLENEDDVWLCCIVGEKDAGHCYACKTRQPMIIHPSSHSYGGGNTTAINYPDEYSSSSDDDY
ncbi:hypothetical protein ACP4OV_020110 [Aristida adscensionis]